MISCQWLQCAFCAVPSDLHPRAFLCALFFLMYGAGLTKEADCAWCGPGKYQTGVGLMAEGNCTWCVAGKYQSGSGMNTAFWLALPTITPVTVSGFRRRLCHILWWLRSTTWLGIRETDSETDKESETAEGGR
jgi:hypothetical protein